MAAACNTPYKLTFGQHKRKTLEEAGPRYCAWLVRDEVYDGKPDLKAALIAANHLRPNSDQFTPPATPTPATPSSRKRRAQSDGEMEVSPSIRRKVTISREAQRNGTMLNYDGSAYILDFGMHAGANLQHVPRDYVDWLIDKGIPDKRPDLKSALLEQGFLRAQQDTPPSSQERPQETSGWTPPNIRETGDTRFFSRHYTIPTWISDADADRYFALKEPVLSSRGVVPVTEADIKREAEFSELVSVTKDRKRWLYQVYKCAEKFGSVPAGRGTADQALKDFLDKNRRSEEEIWESMGPGI
ncbi:MAG: hypothetical protein HETSPECPRED_005262 [Heterodermia speciosa]|uniref:Uncharacterized protein n=1 Tax=Heterodermia speciosa TaxID=116794 RepID=A0A8H3FGN6_9LECA|nr:MAG: hypothetical protein HETSPECPRED_005262 [Heterodermia speciosa]